MLGGEQSFVAGSDDDDADVRGAPEIENAAAKPVWNSGMPAVEKNSRPR